jgi:proteasome lid subunit RPN8/RPN11
MVFMTSSVLFEMIADVTPHESECCGFLFGYEKTGYRTIKKRMAVNNSTPGDKRIQFEITSTDYQNAEKFADQENMTLLGVYHSHPNRPATPSEHDRRSAQPFFSYVILSVREKTVEEVQSWRLDNESRLNQEQIIITNNKLEKIWQQ